jgi:hypothetical protein
MIRSSTLVASARGSGEYAHLLALLCGIMKLLFIVYFFTGTILGPFVSDAQSRGIGTADWAILAGIHGPAVILTAVGIWAARRHGTFLGLSAGAFVFAALLSYGVGAAIGLWAGI